MANQGLDRQMFLWCSPAMPDPSPTRASALASEIQHFAGWTLSVNCPRCRLIREVQVDDMARHIGAGVLLCDVLARLHCRTCGTTPTWVKLAHGIKGTARMVRSVMLIGERLFWSFGLHYWPDGDAVRCVVPDRALAMPPLSESSARFGDTPINRSSS